MIDYVKEIPETSTMDELLAQVAEAGWHVGNMFEVRAGFWRANLYHIVNKDMRFNEFADGKTAKQALAAAIFNMRQPRNKLTVGKKSLSNSDVLGTHMDIAVTNPLSVKQEAYLTQAVERLTEALNEDEL